MSVSMEGVPALTVKRFGFWTALLSAVFYLAFDTACALGLGGVVKDPFWIQLTWYGPSLLLAYSFLGMAVALHHDPLSRNRFWSFCSLVIAAIYCTLNSFVYIIQVFVLAPAYAAGTAAPLALVEMAEGKPLFAVNGLAYALMGLSTLFMAFALKGTVEAKRARILLLIHGLAAPFVLGAVLFKGLFVISATVAVSYPAAAFLVAVCFRQSEKTARTDVLP